MPLIATKYKAAHYCPIGLVNSENIGHNSTWDCPQCGKVWVFKCWGQWEKAWPLRTLWHDIKVLHLQ